MFEDNLASQFERLKAEFDGALYRYYTMQRQLSKLEEDMARMEAGLAELERVRSAWEAQKAVDQAQADNDNKENKR